jgi:putative redox protein
MSVVSTGKYQGGLGMELAHGPSGTVIRTAAPVDNQGDGSSFSPTDLLAAALGSCMCTIMAIVGEKAGLDMSGLAYRAEKHMAASPRRVSRIDLEVSMPAGLSPEQRSQLEAAAMACPVKQSLPDSLETPVRFQYPD